MIIERTKKHLHLGYAALFFLSHTVSFRYSRRTCPVKRGACIFLGSQFEIVTCVVFPATITSASARWTAITSEYWLDVCSYTTEAHRCRREQRKWQGGRRIRRTPGATISRISYPQRQSFLWLAPQIQSVDAVLGGVLRDARTPTMQ